MNTNDKKILALAAAGIIVLGGAVAIKRHGDTLQDQTKYDTAVSLMEQGEYDSAAGIFLSLGSFSNSSERYNDALYHKYCSMLDSGMYDEAAEGFNQLDGYNDSEDMYIECKYRKALSYIENKEYDRAVMAFDLLGDYKDSAELIEKAEQLKKQENNDEKQDNNTEDISAEVNVVSEVPVETEIIELVTEKSSDSSQEIQITAAVFDWRSEYNAILQSYSGEANFMYDLADTNSDGIPELFVSNGMAHVNRVYMYTVYDNSVVSLEDAGAYGTLLYYPSEGMLGMDDGHQGYFNDYYFKIENGNISLLCSFSSNWGVGDTYTYYMIGKNYVTEDEYKYEKSKYEEKEFVIIGREYDITTDIHTINSWK